MPAVSDGTAIVTAVSQWFDLHRRDLPWRRPDASPWGVMVSEFMLQQTPVERVLGPWAAWMERWPTPEALAATPSGEAVRAWGRLGYPRRALRLHQAAVVLTERFDGRVPDRVEELLTLPGVGSYTAAAIVSFAYGQRAVVLDTNVRRVIARAVQGVAQPGPAPTRAETTLAESLVPPSAAAAAHWAVASMELGALVCVARTPRCEICPIRDRCAWRAAGRPAYDGPPRRGQGYAGTDRQCRGALLAVLRSSDEPVPVADLWAAWPESPQRERALASLVADGLVVGVGERFALPS